MPRRKKEVLEENTTEVSSLPPAFSLEEQEDQIIAEAYRSTYQRIKDGTASAMERVYFLKLGSEREKLQREIMKTKAELQKAQVEALHNAEDIKLMYEQAMDALIDYRGGKHE